MELTEIMGLWKDQNEKIDKCLHINTQLLKENIEGKLQSIIFKVRAVRVAGIIIGIVWCTLMAIILFFSWHKTNWFFKTALIIHMSVSLTAIGLYIYHLLLIKNFNYNQRVLAAQQKLVKLQLSNLRTLGLLWLQLPVFSIWFMSTEWMINSPISFWLIQVPIVLLQLFIGVWLYVNLNIKNQQKKWFTWFMSKGEFGKIQKATQLLNEIHNLENQ